MTAAGRSSVAGAVATHILTTLEKSSVVDTPHQLTHPPMFLPFVRLSVLLPLLSVASSRPESSHTATKVQLTLATLHAAALTTPRAESDTVDAPYFLVSIVGPQTKTATLHLPETGHLMIHEDQALGARPLVELSLEPGDSVRLLVSVLVGQKVAAEDEAAAAAASTKAFSLPASARADAVSSALAPVTKDGARWLGSATLLLTNEAGTTYWRALECVATCKVLSGAAATPLPEPNGKAVGGTVELSGSGGTYHMALKGQESL
jgi:hypothetical protein